VLPEPWTAVRSQVVVVYQGWTGRRVPLVLSLLPPWSSRRTCPRDSGKKSLEELGHQGFEFFSKQKGRGLGLKSHPEASTDDVGGRLARESKFFDML